MQSAADAEPEVANAPAAAAAPPDAARFENARTVVKRLESLGLTFEHLTEAGRALELLGRLGDWEPERRERERVRRNQGELCSADCHALHTSRLQSAIVRSAAVAVAGRALTQPTRHAMTLQRRFTSRARGYAQRQHGRGSVNRQRHALTSSLVRPMS